MNIAQANQALQLETVIAAAIPLHRESQWWIGPCPFHADDRPSLVVWPKTQTWRCFGCMPQADDLVGWVRRWQHCDTRGALAWIAAQAPVVPFNRRAPAPSASPVVATVPVRDAYYQAVWRRLPLMARHRKDLAARGVSVAEAARWGLRSWIPGPAPIAPTVAGIPGCYRRRNGPWQLAGPAGLAIPVHDLHGRIQAVQIRVDAPLTPNGKYRWLSSRREATGAAPPVTCHWVPGRADAPIWITEGALKATIAGHRLGAPTIGVPGVSSWARVLPWLDTLRPHHVILAFDQDPLLKTAQLVATFTAQLAQACRERDILVEIARWDGVKGIDDAIHAGRPITHTAWDPEKREVI